MAHSAQVFLQLWVGLPYGSNLPLVAPFSLGMRRFRAGLISPFENSSSFRSTKLRICVQEKPLTKEEKSYIIFQFIYIPFSKGQEHNHSFSLYEAIQARNHFVKIIVELIR